MTDVLSWIRLEGPFLIGHRGYAARERENTPPAFEAALEAGCDGVELDARVSADGIPFVHHDAEARGPQGPLVLEEQTWEILRDTRFSDALGAYRVHSLEDVLAGLTGRCLVNVEVKPPAEARRSLVTAAVYPLIETLRPRESLLVSSFDPEILAELNRYDGSLALGFLFSDLNAFNRLEQEPTVEFLTSIHPRHDLIDARLMKRAGERGLQVHAWTVNDPEEAERVFGLGATAVITDDP